MKRTLGLILALVMVVLAFAGCQTTATSDAFPFPLNIQGNRLSYRLKRTCPKAFEARLYLFSKKSLLFT